MKRIPAHRRSSRLAVAIAVLAVAGAMSAWAIGPMFGPSTTAPAGRMVNGGGTSSGATLAAAGQRVGPPVYRLGTSLTTTIGGQVSARNWQAYE